MLKTVILGVFVILGYNVEAFHRMDDANTMKLIKKCEAETGATHTNIEPFLERLQYQPNTTSIEARIKKLIKCDYTELGIASEDGDVDVDRLLDLYPSHVQTDYIKTAMVECLEDDGEPLDKIYNFYKCFHSSPGITEAVQRKK